MTSSVARSPLPDAKQVPGGIVDCCDLQVAFRERRADDRAAVGRDLGEGLIDGLDVQIGEVTGVPGEGKSRMK
jgi:hypothetical protein